MKARTAAVLLAAAAFVTSLILLFPDWQNWLGFSRAAYFTNGQNYAFFSGIGPCLITAAGLSTLITGTWHALNCRAGGCLRIGHYPDSRGVKWCWRHHPDHAGQRPTTELLHKLHHELKERSS